MNESLRYSYLPDSTRIIAEEIEHLTQCRELFRGLIQQVYQDGKDAKVKEYAEMARKDWEEEMRKTPRL